MESLIINSVVILACAGFFAWRGYEYGLIQNIKGFISIVSAYLACYFFSAVVAELLAQYFGWQPVPSYIAAAVILFVTVSFLIRFSLQLLIDKLEEHDVEPARVAGSAAGVVLGLLLGILVVWTGNIVYDAIHIRTQNTAVLETRELDPVRKLTGDLVGEAVGYVVQHKTGDDRLTPAVTTNLISDPVGMTHKIIAVSKSESIKIFFTDPAIQEMMRQNRFDELTRQPAFIEMMKQPVNREVFGTLSMSIKEAGLTEEQRIARLVTDMWQKSQRLLNDPRFLAMANNPEYRALLGNPAALLASPALGEFADIVFSDAPLAPLPDTPAGVHEAEFAPPVAPVSSIEQTPPIETSQEPTIYRWTDENGRIHFSENKPEGDYEVETTTLRH